MKRGDIVVAVFPGEYGKPRPGVVVQSTAVIAHPSLTLCPLTTDIHEPDEIRVRVSPTPENGLRLPSEIMVDKIASVRRERVRAHIGSIDSTTLRSLDTALRVWLGLV